MRARTITSTVAIVALAFLALLSTTSHTVTRGETLAQIARRYGTSVSALAQANGITDPNRIYAGQRLEVGGAAAGPAAPSAGATHTVVRGDTLGTIARRAGTSVAALVSLNRLTNPNLIRVGQVLQLPAGGAAPPAPSAGARPPAGGATTHVVRRGDTLGGIAARYGIPQQQIIDANGLTGGIVYLGQQLRLVPVAGTTPAPRSTGGTHTVRAGETLSSIARRYGTTTRAIQDANGISDPNRIVVGRTLKIPAGGSGGGVALRCPVAGAVTFMNDWGFPRSGGRFHQGNDLFAPRGRQAVAVVAGTVTQSTSRLGGNQVRLAGDDGVVYHYTHLDRFARVGRVAAGDVVGYVGSSGNAAGGPPHVHFEVHPGGGAPVNPYPRIVEACR